MHYELEQESSLNSRPKISVCMAAYNGELYIDEQLRSILAQLTSTDEIIIVDDVSTDATCSKIAAIGDPRVSVFHNTINQGVYRTFESALTHASGEIVFLSDQDDIWLPGKVDAVLSIFAQDSKVFMVASDAYLIDAKGTRTGDSYYAVRGRFRSGIFSNILVCRFLGCTMAFRKALVQEALPLPKAQYVSHDLWLGLVNTLLHGKTTFIDKPLMSYRRHENNYSGRIKNSFVRLFRMRLQRAIALFGFYIRHLFGKQKKKVGGYVTGPDTF